MRRSYVAVVMLSLIGFVAVLTNPNQDRHKEVVKNELIKFLQKSINLGYSEPKDNFEQAGQAIGIMLGGAIVDRILDNFMSIDNYVVISATKITWDGKTKIIGIGAFGNVYLTKELNEALNKGLLNENK